MMLKSKYEGNIIIRKNLIQVYLLENAQTLVLESSVKQLLFDYKSNVENVPELVFFEDLNGKTNKAITISSFVELCKNYKGRRLSNNLANTVLSLFDKFGIENIVNQVVGYEINEQINEVIMGLDNEKSNQPITEFDKSVKNIIK